MSDESRLGGSADLNKETEKPIDFGEVKEILSEVFNSLEMSVLFFVEGNGIRKRGSQDQGEKRQTYDPI